MTDEDSAVKYCNRMTGDEAFNRGPCYSAFIAGCRHKEVAWKAGYENLMNENDKIKAALREERDAYREALEKAEAGIVDTCEDFGRANFKFCNDPDYAGPISQLRYYQLRDALTAIRAALEKSPSRIIPEEKK